MPRHHIWWRLLDLIRAQPPKPGVRPCVDADKSGRLRVYDCFFTMRVREVTRISLTPSVCASELVTVLHRLLSQSAACDNTSYWRVLEG